MTAEQRQNIRNSTKFNFLIKPQQFSLVRNRSEVEEGGEYTSGFNSVCSSHYINELHLFYYMHISSLNWLFVLVPVADLHTCHHWKLYGIDIYHSRNWEESTKEPAVDRVCQHNGATTVAELSRCATDIKAKTKFELNLCGSHSWRCGRCLLQREG